MWALTALIAPWSQCRADPSGAACVVILVPCRTLRRWLCCGLNIAQAFTALLVPWSSHRAGPLRRYLCRGPDAARAFMAAANHALAAVALWSVRPRCSLVTYCHGLGAMKALTALLVLWSRYRADPYGVACAVVFVLRWPLRRYWCRGLRAAQILMAAANHTLTPRVPWSLGLHCSFVTPPLPATRLLA